MSLVTLASPVLAQCSNIQIVMPWAAGGSADTIGRLTGNQMSKQLGRLVKNANIEKN